MGWTPPQIKPLVKLPGNWGEGISSVVQGVTDSNTLANGGKMIVDAASGDKHPTTFGHDDKRADKQAAQAARAEQDAANAQAAAAAEQVKQEKIRKAQMAADALQQNTDQARTQYQDQTTGLLDPVAAQYQQAAGTQIGANVDPTFRNYQMGLAQQLQQQAMGQGPSLAQMQLQQATDRTMQQTLGNIRAGVGANSALAGRTAALAGSQQLAQQGGNSAILRLQEQQQAQQALAGLSDQARGQDVSTAGLSQAAQIAQANNTLGAINGMAGVRGKQLDAYGNLYSGASQTNQAAINNAQTVSENQLNRDAASTTQANTIEADKQKEKLKAKNGLTGILAGGAITAAASYLGSKAGK